MHTNNYYKLKKFKPIHELTNPRNLTKNKLRIRLVLKTAILHKRNACRCYLYSATAQCLYFNYIELDENFNYYTNHKSVH